ncbi:hypothetical protein [Nostoc sp.]|uniref:hypothetical protein n=1 Tax=Nostoc sp. TaxID=1180 RepID=UPI002FFCF198
MSVKLSSEWLGISPKGSNLPLECLILADESFILVNESLILVNRCYYLVHSL